VRKADVNDAKFVAGVVQDAQAESSDDKDERGSNPSPAPPPQCTTEAPCDNCGACACQRTGEDCSVCGAYRSPLAELPDEPHDEPEGGGSIRAWAWPDRGSWNIIRTDTQMPSGCGDYVVTVTGSFAEACEESLRLAKLGGGYEYRIERAL